MGEAGKLHQRTEKEPARMGNDQGRDMRRTGKDQEGTGEK